MQSKNEYLEEILTKLWRKSEVNPVIATDLTVYICNLANSEEPKWENFGNFDIDANESIEVSNVLLLNPDFKEYLERFLFALLKAQRFDVIYKFFDKAFISHVCNTNYTSKNASKFAMFERSFDRFIEAIKFTGINVDEIMSLLLNAVTSNSDCLISKWHRPSADFLIEIIRQNDNKFSKYLFSHFDEIGISALEFLYSVDADLAINDAIKLYENILYKPSIRSFLKQYSSASLKAIEKAKQENILDLDNYVDLLLIFSFQKDLEPKFIELFNTITEPSLRRKILEKIDIPLKKSITTLAQFNRAINRFTYNDDVVLGVKLSEYPGLILKDKENAHPNTTPMLIKKYIELCSPKSNKELDYFKDFIDSTSLDLLCDFVAEKYLISGTNDDEWAITLVSSNYTLEKLIESLTNLFAKLHNRKEKVLDFILEIVTTVRRDDIVNIVLNLDKSKSIYPKMSAKLLKIIQQKHILELNDFELLCDKLVPDYDLNEKGIKQIKTPQGMFEIHLINGKTVEVYGLNGVDIETLSIKKRAEILHERDEILREISKQARRLEKVFYDNRKWTKKDFFAVMMKNPILKAVVSGLLWAEYAGDSIAKIFCINSDKIENIVSYKTVPDEKIMIGIFHPVESSGQEWLEIFVPLYTPFNQLQRDVYSMDKFTKLNSAVSRFNGTIVSANVFTDRMIQAGWIFGVVNQLNKVTSMFKVNSALGILCEIDFNPMEIDVKGQDITLGELRFYRLNNAILLGKTWKTSKINSMEITTIPPRLFSDTLYEIAVCSKK